MAAAEQRPAWWVRGAPRRPPPGGSAPQERRRAGGALRAHAGTAAGTRMRPGGAGRGLSSRPGRGWAAPFCGAGPAGGRGGSWGYTGKRSRALAVFAVSVAAF